HIIVTLRTRGNANLRACAQLGWLIRSVGEGLALRYRDAESQRGVRLGKFADLVIDETGGLRRRDDVHVANELRLAFGVDGPDRAGAGDLPGEILDLSKGGAIAHRVEDQIARVVRRA